MSLRAVFLALVMLAALGCGGSSAGPNTSGAGRDGSVTLNVALRGPHYRLPNGLEVFLHPDRSLRNVVVNVRYHVGAKDDPPGRSGFAHLYEHLMFLGSKHVPAGGFTKALDDAAALAHNAFTTSDVTEYYEVLPPSQLPIALWLESDRMAHPIDRVDDDTFRRERDVVKNEWRERYDNQPYGHVSSIVRAAVFPEGHPYHRAPIGSVEDLDRASIAEARAFATRYYVPSNATLVVAGDFDIAEVRPIVDRVFGRIAPGTPPAQRTFAPVRLDKDRRVTVEADVDAPRVVVAWPAPPLYGRNWYEISFACTLIAGMTSHKLETEQKIASDVSCTMNPGRLGTILQINVHLDKKGTPDAAIDAIERRVTWASRLERQPGYTWNDLPTSKTRSMTSSVLALSDLEDRAARMQDYLDYFGEADSAQAELRKIQAVRASDIAIATEELLGDAGKVVVVVVPKRGAPRSGRVVK